MVCCQYLISGRVQGVGFRKFTAAKALQIGLVGWVRNLDDGRVEALAQGSKEQLEEFERVLRQGPSAAKVANVEKFQLARELTETSFSMLRDGEEPWSDKL